MGQHYKVRSLKNMHVHRHYSVCDVMQPDVYRGLVESLKTDDSALVVKQKNNFSQNFTVKNYKTQDGVSFRFF